MQRGFKTQAKKLALELRGEIGLTPHMALDPYALAAEYGVPVYRLSELKISDGALRHCGIDNPRVFSGALVDHGRGLAIIGDDFHSVPRRRSTLSHELAHVVLEHPHDLSLTYDRKCGAGADHEAEADWLAAELLIPSEAAFRLAWADAADQFVSDRFGVSLVYAQWRMNHSGARKVVASTRRKRGMGSECRLIRGRLTLCVWTFIAGLKCVAAQLVGGLKCSVIARREAKRPVP